jgi:transposase
MLIASKIGDISKFSTTDKLVSWCGLCPTVHQSGNSMYMGRMKKRWKQKDKLDYDTGCKYCIKNR